MGSMSEDSFKVNEDGDMQEEVQFNLTEIRKHCKNLTMFLKGFNDGFRNEEFMESDVDYIKGFKYSKTKIFDD